MVNGGMAIGAHTHTHRVLGTLFEPDQQKELTERRRWLRDRIGVEVKTLSYPLGSASSFTEQTKRLAAEAGYRAAFSFYGGINRSGATERFDVRRVGAARQSVERFETQAVLAAVTNHFWP
jgi:peptidoglycan/xylan/chitin deacetylase (PgdA/CDA1 family)